MHIRLAYPYKGHERGEVIVVDDRTGKRLLKYGKGREVPPPPPPPPPVPKRTYKPYKPVVVEPTEPVATGPESEVE